MNGPPICDICGAAKKWREAGTRRDGTTFDAFWGCPNYKNHPPKGQAGPPAAQARPQTAPAPNPGSPSREGSIEAQAACKAACEATASLFATSTGSNVAAAENVTVRLAQRLLREVIAPWSKGELLHSPTATQDEDIPF
jgi:hypothetical protein